MHIVCHAELVSVSLILEKTRTHILYSSVPLSAALQSGLDMIVAAFNKLNHLTGRNSPVRFMLNNTQQVLRDLPGEAFIFRLHFYLVHII